MSKSELDGLSLGQLFSKGQAVLTELDESSLSSIDPEYQKTVQRGLEYLQRADTLIARLDIFSDNEIIDDINTNDLKFLLTTAYLGDLQLKVSGKEVDRGQILNQSKEYIERFLNTCQEHELLDKQDLVVKEQLEHKTTSKLSAAQQREQKITRFKRERAMKQQVQDLRAQIDATAGEDEDRDIEDMERDWVEALINLEILKAIENWHAINQEIVMVKEMEETRSMMEKMGNNKSTVAVDQEPVNTRANWGKDKPMLSKQGKPLQPFVIMNKREQLKSQVFGYSHNLPTMTIDEYLEQEEARGNIIKGGGEPPEKPEIEDNDYEAHDRETMKKREWDEFVEANPRGAGNRGNKG